MAAAKPFRLGPARVGVTTVLGVDARGRAPFWTVRIEDGAVQAIEPFDGLDEALEAPAAAVVAVDVALGHEDPQGETDGLRACDRAARELLGEAADRLFALPPPAVFEVASYHEALETCRARGWPHLEAPLWFARERLQALALRAGEDERLVEVHPEISFAVMKGIGDQVGPAERYGETWAALHERLRLLHDAGLHPEGHLDGDERSSPRRVLDAAAAAWSARRVARGQSRPFPEDPPADPRTGRKVAIHA